jgi:hypothetical protein
MMMASTRDAARAGREAFVREWREYPRTHPFQWTHWIAWLTIVGSVLYYGFSIVGDFTSPSLIVDLPVRADWSPGPDGTTFDGGLSHLTDGSITSLHATVTDPALAVRIWSAVNLLIVGTMWVWIALVTRATIRRVRSGSPFVPQLSRGVRAVAFVVMVGGILAQVSFGISATLVSSSTLGSGWSSAGPTSVAPMEPGTLIGVPFSSVSVSVDFWPIGVGLVLLVLARLIRIGERFQRDAEGLV